MTDPRRCTRCGNPLPPDVALGICPACMRRVGWQPAFGQPPHGSAGDEVTNGFKPNHPGHVLESLAQSIGSIPRILLPDTAADDAGVAVIKPSSDEMPALAERGDRYELFGEIARGGMGAVLKGRDRDLGRDLAVKVLLESHQDKPDLVRRFVEEAQISGQLQHPGIVPVYELGTFADRRPYFTMKLVKGRTLAALLAERSSPGDDLPRFLSIFEAVCQTSAYAHARGVIHRDLKPSNIMVGSFGEVQVMDWGLAKVLREGGIADEPPVVQPALEVSVIATVRSGSDVNDSQAGSVLGTPAYMAPEQAVGEIERVDRRADVFGLGSILCELLTGQAAYTGRSQHELLRKAMRGDTGDALARLDGCGAEAELVSIAKHCIAFEPEDRPRDAGLVAGRITAYLSGVQARLQAAERERAVAVARAIEERRRRKLHLGLGAAVLALTTLGGLSTTYYLHQRQAWAAAIDQVLVQVVTLRDQAAARPEDPSLWQVALDATEQADAVGNAQARARLLALRTEIQAGVDAGKRDRTLLDRLVDIHTTEADDPEGSMTDAAYAGAFRKAGIDPESLPPAEAAAKFRARPPSVRLALAWALDNWAAIRRGRRADAAGSLRLSEAARAADPYPSRSELRAALDLPDQKARLAALQALAKTALVQSDQKARLGPDYGSKFEDLSAPSLNLLGTGLNDAGDSDLAASVLRSAQQLFPADVWVNYSLAKVLEKLSRRDEAILYYTAARAIRPETAHALAHALKSRGDSDKAVAVFRDLKRLRPGNARHLACLVSALEEKGLAQEAAELVKTSLALGRVDLDLGQELIRLRPDDGVAHFSLGRGLAGAGMLDRAIAEYRTAIRLKPDYSESHLGLGEALSSQGKLDEAIAEFRTVIRVNPDAVVAHIGLGNALQQKGDYAGGLEMYRKGHELGSRMPGWQKPLAALIAGAERKVALAKRLPAILQGEDKPRDNAERLEFAQIAYDQKHFAAATRLWAEALEKEPKVADDPRTAHRYNAACAAALTAAGQGKDDPPADDTAKAKLRQQALDWLKADLTAWGKFLEAGAPQARLNIVLILDHWKQDADLAGVRDGDAIAIIPADEQKAWQSLWAEVDSLLKRAGSLQ